MFDSSFFALLFLLASSLAPDSGAERTWINSRYPQQTIQWTHAGDGWAMTINGREMGVFHRDGDAIVHHTGQGEPQRFSVDALAPEVPAGTRRIVLRGRFAPTVLSVERAEGRVTIVDPTRELLRVPLILGSR